MITRIVKLEFKEHKTKDFLQLFDTVANRINEFPGCAGMKLYQDIDRPNIIITYSYWASEEKLNNYRNSDVFNQIWPKLKPWFSAKPVAWSVSAYFDGFRSTD
jgi:quinol monooxygenase YgiN